MFEFIDNNKGRILTSYHPPKADFLGMTFISFSSLQMERGFLENTILDGLCLVLKKQNGRWYGYRAEGRKYSRMSL